MSFRSILVFYLFLGIHLLEIFAILRDEDQGQRETGNVDEQGEFLQGDIALTASQLLELDSLRAGIQSQRWRWPKGAIPYTMDSRFSNAEKLILTSAMEEVSQKTCIRFLPRDRHLHPNSIHFKRGVRRSGCWSYVGRTGYPSQTVNLEPGNFMCIQKGIVMHELTHVIGFFHEQSRTDRDDFVKIVSSNVIPGFLDQFSKRYHTESFGVPYDFDSVMHYSAFAFSKNRKATVMPRNDMYLPRIGQRRGYSSGDILKINNMYSGIC